MSETELIMVVTLEKGTLLGAKLGTESKTKLNLDMVFNYGLVLWYIAASPADKIALYFV